MNDFLLEDNIVKQILPDADGEYSRLILAQGTTYNWISGCLR